MDYSLFEWAIIGGLSLVAGFSVVIGEWWQARRARKPAPLASQVEFEAAMGRAMARRARLEQGK